MRIAGIIAEYNPFHNGHAYHIEKTRELTSADAVVVLMSGSHVQRGEPAVYDKYRRTGQALQGGADAVFEMPAYFSTASAREFASYGVSFFAKAGIDVISFGSESGNIALFKKAASLLETLDADSDYNQKLKDYLKSGMSFPSARAKAVKDVTGESFEAYDSLFSSPNNILGLEYISAAIRLKNQGLISREPDFATVKREGAGYHDRDASDSAFTSATAERKRLLEERLHGASDPYFPVFADDYSSLLNYRLLTGEYQKTAYSDVNEAILSKLSKLEPGSRSFSSIVEALKTKDLTYTRISRALLHILLKITDEDANTFKNYGYASYGRILGFRKDKSPVIKEIMRRSEIPIVTKLGDAARSLDETALKLMNHEIMASHIYQNIQSERSGLFKNEFRQGPVIL